jgi:hypothetical protein
MAASISLLNTRTMLQALEELRTPNTFLLRKFFSAQKECPTKAVDIDIYKGKRRVAAYVNRRAQGQTIDRVGYSTYTYEPPYLKPKMVTTVEDLLVRQPGEVVYSGNQNAAQRAAAQLGKDLAELDSIITRAEELQASQALFDGKVEIHDQAGNDVVADIDFQRSETHTVDLTATGQVSWDESGATPLKDIRTWKRLIAQDAGVGADICILGSDAADEFLENADVRAVLDNRNVHIGSLEMEAQELGVVYIGTIEGVAYYAYDEWYVNPSTGTETALVPAKKALLGSTRARCERVYGVIEDAEGVFAAARFPKTWTENDPSVRLLQLHSAPLCVPVQVDGFVVATVLA